MPAILTQTPDAIAGVDEASASAVRRPGGVDETDATRFHQGVGRHDGNRAGRLCDNLRHGGGATPVSAAMVRAGQAGRSAQGDWIALDLPGLHAVVRDPDLRAGRTRGARPRQPLSRTNHGYVCRGAHDPAAGYDPDRVKVPMKRTNPVKGRGVDPKWVPITWDEALTPSPRRCWSCAATRGAQAGLYARSLLANVHGRCFTAPCAGLRYTNYFSHSAICAEAEKMGPGLPRVLRLSRLRPRRRPTASSSGVATAVVEPRGADTIHRFTDRRARAR